MKAIDLKGKTFYPPLFLAPMAGLTERCLRRSIYKMGSLSGVFTELVPVFGLLNSRLKVEDYIKEDETNYTFFQLCGSDESKILKAAEICVEKGIKFIDINFGCPVNKITKGGGGSALLKDPEKCGKIVDNLLKNLDVIVTAKIRSGWDDRSLNFVEVGKILEESGVAMVTLHPRTRKQMYKGKAQWEHIKELKQNLKIPVIGNGDVLTKEDTKRMFEETGCDGVMIGRGAIKNPFIFVESVKLIENGHYETSTLKTKIDFIEEHIKNLEEAFEGQKSLHFAKVFIGKVTKGIQGSSSLRNSLSTLKNIKDLRNKIEAFRNTILKEE